LRQYSGRIFIFAIAGGMADYNPTKDLSDALKTREVESFKSMPIGF
jgi:hypothetical protein